ncbi:LAFA_0G01706g1_1 [Lachancea sp. 'fantastica']|nr:LAFA_0G01706g1_1 [Lachancea sp. 'fantastica']
MVTVTNRAITFVNSKSVPSISSHEIDLDACYKGNEIVVKVHAAALNPIDLMVYHAAYPWLAGKHEKTFSRDYSGEVVKVGSRVKGFEVGDKIVGLFQHLWGAQGTLSNYLVLDPTVQCAVTKVQAFEDPQYSDYVLNAAYPLVFGTAYQALTGNGQKLGPDSRILVIGASTSVSSALVQIAKNHLKVGTVVGTCSKKSFDYNKAFGFDHLVAYDEGDQMQEIQKLVKTDFGNQKFDLIFDSVGSSDFFANITEILKDKHENSHYSSVAGDTILDYSNISLTSLLPSWESLRRWGPFRKYNYKYVLLRKDPHAMATAAQMIADKKYRPPIDSVHKFDDFADAFKRLSSHRAKGKVVIEVS